jgi:glycosyltransferase involved in cell wall biosynthesis
VKIAHLCLAGAFTEGMSYQDNVLVDVNRRDGHDVLIVSDCMMFRDGQLEPVEPEDRILANGARLVRLPFDVVGPGWFTQKIKKSRRLLPLLEDFDPDVILYHGVIGWSLLTLRDYKQRHPSTKIYVDSHEDRHNSATNWISYTIQYRLLTRSLVQKILPYIEKILYISLETKDFLTKVLDLPEPVLEYYPLGGSVVPDAERRAIRSVERAKLGIAVDDVVFLHSGKLDYRKRSLEILAAFRSVEDRRAKLLIVGRLDDGNKEELERAIAADDRVMFLGWANGDRLTAVMCASDVYVQPGGQSSSLQHAICCGLPILVRHYPSHEPFVRGNGYFVESQTDIAKRMAEIVASPDQLEAMRAASYEVAYGLLDYRKLGARLYH